MDPAVVLISDDDRNEQLESVVIISDDEINIDEVEEVEEEALESVVIISDDDGDDVRDLKEEDLEKEHDGKYSESNNHKDVLIKRLRNKGNYSDERVDCVHQGSNDLQELSLYECKSYLRKHGMRVSGTKEECIQRIKEHERLKDGRGESLYPVSSFSINCTGDACKGDIVLFKQDIKDGVNIVGKRTVAGKILKESYGASSQHTFSVEVLWSKFSKKLNPLSILLMKGRNFYKFGTLRQPWENEAERLKVLEEKHSRGDAARQKWKLRQTKFASITNKGAKRQKVSHDGPSQSKHSTQVNKQKPAERRSAAAVKESMTTDKRKAAIVPFRKMKFKRSTKLIFCPVLNSNLNTNSNRKWKKNRNLNPNLDSYSYADRHQEEASSSFPYDTTLVPFGHHINQQSGPNHVFNQGAGYCYHNYDRPITRLKSLYPRSSFSIDCKDDACKGDVVLFKQNIYKRGKIVRKKRTVAGRIVEESYGASNKQHTFTVEVLWTKPTTIRLPPFSTLQLKDWKLYKFGTFRQPRKNEAKRSKLLVKKHRQVLAARHKRKLRKTDIASNNNQGAKRQKVSHRGFSQRKQPSRAAHVKECTTTHKRKTRSQKKELKRASPKIYHSDPNPIPNPKPNLKPKANLGPNPNSNQNANPNPNPNPNPSPNLNPNPKPNPNPNKLPSKVDKQKYAKRRGAAHVRECSAIHKRKTVWFQKKKLKRSTQLTFHPDPNPNSNLYPNSNSKLKPKAKANPDPDPSSTQKTNPSPNPNPNLNPEPNPNKYQKTNPNPYPNRCIHSYDRPSLPNQLPVGFSPYQPPLGSSPNHPSLSFCPNQPSLGFLPNQPPFGFSQNQPSFGFSPNQQPLGFSPNQQPFGFPTNRPHFRFSGYGGQWGPNYAFYQSPGYSHYNLLTALATTLLSTSQSSMYQHRR